MNNDAVPPTSVVSPVTPATAPVAPSKGLRATADLARWAVWLAVAQTVVDWVGAVLAPISHHKLVVAAASGHSGHFLNTLHTPFSAFSQVLSVVVVAGVVVTYLWLRRVRENAEVLTPGSQQLNGAMVWLGWIPVLSLYFPRRLMAEIVAGTFPAGKRPQIETWWWTWVVFQALQLVDAAVANTVARGTTWRIDPIYSVLLAVVTTIALVPWIQLVRQISTAQDEAIS